jgi:hypothetical protein
MAAFNKFNNFVDWVSKGTLNLGTDAFKVLLTNTAPVATNSIYSDISATELATGAGYTTGGAAVTPTLSNAAGTEKLVGTNPTWTASASMGPFRYVVLYDSTPASNKALVGWWDYGSSITLLNTQTFTVTFDGTNGIFQIA